MNNPKISLIFCCYNVSKYLDKIFEWLENNLKHNIEVIFVEDCSTDNTKDILKKFVENCKCHNVKLVENAANQGLSESRNIGVIHSSGKYIGFPDPDDEFYHNWIYEILDIIESDSPDVIVTAMREDYEIDNIHQYSKDVLCVISGLASKDNLSSTLVELEKPMLFGYMNNKIYRSNIIKNNGLKCRNMVLKEDFDFNCRLFSYIKSIYILNKPYYIYKKRNNSSLTNKFVPEYWSLHIKSLNQFKALLEKQDSLSRESEKILVNRFFRWLLSAIERNANELSKMNFRQQVKWISDIYREKTNRFYFERVNLLEGKLKLFLPLFKFEMKILLVLMAQGIKFIKTKAPIIFSKVK